MTREATDKYTTVFDEENKRFVRTDLSTGQTWSWPYKKRPSRKKHTVSSNGVTLEKLTKAGHKVRIRHFRYATYNPHDSFRGLFRADRETVVPSTFRHSPYYRLSPKGGFTHITIQITDTDYICLSSECSTKDPFCYNSGITIALSRLTQYDLHRLELQ
jgi:hypothetical protein